MLSPAADRWPYVDAAITVSDDLAGMLQEAHGLADRPVVVLNAPAVGVLDRVHLLSYVPHWQVVPLLSGADAGVIPIHHWPNHEVSLITKFFEYAHARLPLVVSDVRTMSATVRATGQGEVFTAEDIDDYVRAVRAVLDDPERYRAAYDKPGLLDGWTWAAQAEVLNSVYRRLLGEQGEK
jgi:glycogen synthase